MKASLPGRREDLHVVEMPGEVLVYDPRRHRAFCLNRPASLVWSLCDGTTTVDEARQRLASELGNQNVDEAYVLHTLALLQRAGLLRRNEGKALLTRRRFLRVTVLAGAGAIILPTVASVTVADAAHAATCLAPSDCSDPQNKGKPCNPPECNRRCRYRCWKVCWPMPGGGFECEQFCFGWCG